MRTQRVQRMTQVVVALAMLAALMLPSMATVQAAPFDGQRQNFADDRFDRVWTRTDGERVRGGRSWYWGPGPWFDYAEFYRESPNGLRTVQYFDKARMEINQPAERGGAWQGATNGLLVKELVSGRMQLGDNPYDVDVRQAADVPVAGNPRLDNPIAPGYVAFAGVATLDNDYRDPQRLGERVSVTLDRGGNLGLRPDLARPETEIVQYNSVTGHNIPRIFWDFMNRQGRIQDGALVATGPLVDWLFAMGLPISDPYWTRARVGGSEQDVLVQLFERRVLTYTPANPVGYQVEMGNVGQHYFQWRYPHLGQPWTAPDPNPPIVYASNLTTGSHWELHIHYQTGPVQVTQNNAESVAMSYRRSYEPNQTRILIDSRRGNEQHRQIYELDPAVLYGGSHQINATVRRLTYSDGTVPPPTGPYPGYLPHGPANDYNPSCSPDGTKIAFISDRYYNPELFIMPASGNLPIQLTTNGCVNESPAWSPDGRSLYWVNNCSGQLEIYGADLVYQYDSRDYIDVQLVNQRQLTSTTSSDRFPRVSPDGRSIVFTSYRDGNGEIYLMNIDGSNQRRLTNHPAEDEAATWSADGRQLAFASDRDGNYEIYVMNIDGTGLTRLTNNTAHDRWSLWAQ